MEATSRVGSLWISLLPLTVERELERVTRDIEQIKGRLALLGELLRFSTITVNFQTQPVETVAKDNPLPFEWLQRLGCRTC